MSPTSKEELRKFEQRMHDKGSDGFADGPRPWEHWDESGNQANSRVWEGSARRVFASRRAHSLGHRLLSLLAFLALATLLVGIGGVYYTHVQTQQVAQQDTRPLPVTSRKHSVSPVPEPLVRAETDQVEELNVLTAPAAGSEPAGTAALAAEDETAAADSAVATAPAAAGITAPVLASVDGEAEEPEAVTAELPAPPPVDSNVDSVSIETVVTEKSVTTTVYTRHPQQDEPEVIAAIETTPPPFVHEVPPAAGIATMEADSASDISLASTGDARSAQPTTVEPAGMDGTAAPQTDGSQDMLTLTSPGAETFVEETLTAAPLTSSDDSAIMAPAETGTDTGAAGIDPATPGSQETTAPAPAEAETGTEESVKAVATDSAQDTAAIMATADREADATASPSGPAAEETTAEAPASEEATQIALAEPTSAVESTAPAESVQASIPVKQPVLPAAKQGGWVINLASYTWKSTANKKLALFRDKGVDAEVFKVMIKDKPMYRVRVTGFESSRAARAEVASIEQALDLEGAWVSRR